jgi:hypothetical protein
MLPQFPQFKSIELSDKEDVEKITNKYPPYSDFNFVSMWSWDIKGEMLISKLNDNLVVKFTDYMTGKPFYSFLGDNKINETAETLLEFSKKEGLESKLKLVPKDSIKNIDTQKFEIKEDRNHFDYVYSTKELASFLGSKHSNSRRLTNRFIKRNPNIRIENLDLTQIEHRMQVLKLDNFWKKNKEFNFDVENQEKSLMRLINSVDYLSLVNVGVFLDNELVSFTINEKLQNQHSISHFAKFNIQHNGAYLHSMKTIAERLLKDGYDYINCEQDLGLLGLRSSKKALCPLFYLKKYTLEKLK